jgi:hypothetical protein
MRGARGTAYRLGIGGVGRTADPGVGAGLVIVDRDWDPTYWINIRRSIYIM